MSRLLAKGFKMWTSNFNTVNIMLKLILRIYEWSPPAHCLTWGTIMFGIALHKAQVIIVYATLKGRFRLNLTSQVRAGAVLLQEDEQGIDCPVSYFSRKFASYQSSYSVIERKRVRDNLGTSAFWCLCRGCWISCNHNPLTFLQSLQNPNQRLTL